MGVDLVACMRQEDLVACMQEEGLVACMRQEDLAACMRQEDLVACAREVDLAGRAREVDLAAYMRQEDSAGCVLDSEGCVRVGSVAWVVVALGVPLSLGPDLLVRAASDASLRRGPLLGREIDLRSTIG